MHTWAGRRAVSPVRWKEMSSEESREDRRRVRGRMQEPRGSAKSEAEKTAETDAESSESSGEERPLRQSVAHVAQHVRRIGQILERLSSTVESNGTAIEGVRLAVEELKNAQERICGAASVLTCVHTATQEVGNRRRVVGVPPVAVASLQSVAHQAHTFARELACGSESLCPLSEILPRRLRNLGIAIDNVASMLFEEPPAVPCAREGCKCDAYDNRPGSFCCRA